MKSRESLLSFLMELGTSGIPHSGGGLLSHLLGTDVILEHWGAPSHVCRAGLFHAVYGTHSFHDSPLSPTDDSRSRIRDVIGPEAEDVVYCYSILDYASIERSLTGVSSRDLASAVVCVQTSARRVLSVPAATLVSILNVVIANEAEQFLHAAYPVSSYVLSLSPHHLSLVLAGAKSFVLSRSQRTCP